VNISRRAVLESEDLRRILALPRRTPGDLEQLADQLTKILKTPYGTMRLRPIQALALYEIGKHGGLFGPIRVGGGKTLLSLLVPFVLDARRPVLLLPAALKKKTEDERRELSKHWRIGQSLRLISYEELGRDGKAHELSFYRPDVIIADEAHRLKNKKAGVTRRVVRYMREDPRTKKHWEPLQRPKFIGISGTMLSRRSILSFAHMLQWSHREGAPIPLHDGELQEWAEALDETTNFTRPHPGALLRLATDEDRVPGDDLTTARRGFRRRLVETPGVVSTRGEQVACSLYIRGLFFKTNEITASNVEHLRRTWSTPDGWPLSMAAEVWRVARELALGFHGVWDPRPPGFKSREEPGPWLAARQAWAAFVRTTLSRSRTLDTEAQVAKACARGELPDAEYLAWMNIKDTFRINPKDVWHDTSALEFCEEWMKSPGIVWVSHAFFGDELERRTGFPYFREEGLDKKGNSLATLSELIKKGKAKAGPIIASRFACATGFNLQPWHRNLITSCPSGADVLEQLIGRSHRDGQESDQVEVDIMLGCVENFESWERARAEARMAVDALGDSQKILIADLLMPSEYEISCMKSPLWTKTLSEKKPDEPLKVA
jgi:hypothetical protein